MTRADAVAARLGAGHDGILTHALLSNDGGLSAAEIRWLRHEGVLQPIVKGIYRHAAVPNSRRGALRAALLAGGAGAAVSHRSAAELHELDGVPRFRPEIVVTSRDVPRLPGILTHRTDRLDPQDVVVTRGFPVTSVPLTLLHLGAVVHTEVVAHAAQTAMIRRQVDLPALLAVLERVGRRGRPGTAALRAVVRQSLPDAGIASLLEQRLVELVRSAGLPAPVLQHELRCRDGRSVRLDLAWPQWRLAVEADGHRWHGTRAQLERDLARSRSIQSSGWAHYRYGWDDVHRRRARTMAELRAVVPGG